MFWYKLLRLICIPYFEIFFPTRVINRGNLLAGGAICICNHYSLADSMIMTTKFFPKGYHAVIKKEAFSGKFANKFLTEMGMIPIDRSISDLEAMRRIIKCLRNGEKVLVYPEGTRNKDMDENSMRELKHGIFMFAHRTGAPIVPMMYLRRHKLFHRNLLIVGEPIFIEKYRNSNYGAIKDELSADVTAAMQQLRLTLNDTAVERKLKRLR